MFMFGRRANATCFRLLGRATYGSGPTADNASRWVLLLTGAAGTMGMAAQRPVGTEPPVHMGLDKMVVKLLVDPNETMRALALEHLLKQGEVPVHLWVEVSPLLADPSKKVREKAKELLQKIEQNMPAELEATLLVGRAQPLLHHKDPLVRDFARRFLEKRISARALTDGFQEIVLPLLIDPQLQDWALHLLPAKLSPTDLASRGNTMMELLATTAGPTKLRILRFLLTDMPETLRAGVLCQNIVPHIMAVLVDSEERAKIEMLELVTQERVHHTSGVTSLCLLGLGRMYITLIV